MKRLVTAPLGLIDRLHAFAERLGLSPKVFDPLVVAVLAIVANWVISGAFDTGELRLAVVAVLYGIVGIGAPVLPGVELEDVKRELGPTGKQRVRRARARRRR